ncbi:ABC transporter permease [Streptomyces sp. RFCAC02]|uniref:ABC transporter permease n=1 Tax=Streptomyces sp. RFCAC02 TaxID=2499143 RepID=UPI003207A0E1
MLRYALATLRARTSGFVGAFLALFCAAALVTACGSLLETGLRGPILTERYAATPIVVTADQNVHHETRKNDKTKHKAKPVYERVWLPADTAERLTDLPGADAVITELTFPATPLDERGHPFGGPEALGHAWSSAPLTPFTLTDGTAPGQPGEIVLDRALADRAGLSVGDTVTVQSTGDPAAHTVTGIADGALTEQAAVFFSDEEARGLAGHDGRITMAGLFPADGTTTAELADRARAALDGTSAVVRTGDDRGQSEFPGAEQARVQLVSMGGAVGGTGLIVAVLVVVGTFGLTAHARAREFALLRAVAATPRQIRRLIGREALLVALAAGPLGALAGLPLSGWLYDRLTGLGTVPETVGQVHSLFPMAAAVLATLPTAWLAARISARRPARVRPAQALTEAAAEPRRTPLPRLIAGFAALAGGVVLLFVLTVLHIEPASTPVTYLTVLLLSIAVALLGPTLCRVAFTLIGAPLRWCGVPGHLAAHNARAGARRLASVITPLTLLVAMACTVLFTQTTLTAAAERQARDGVVADRVVAAAGPGVPHAAVETLRDTDGVTAVTEVTHSTVRTPGLDKYSVQGSPPVPGSTRHSTSG